MIPEEVIQYLEAAYLYYLHPEYGITMTDSMWDELGRKLHAGGLIERTGSLFHMKEEDYPSIIRDKYK